MDDIIIFSRTVEEHWDHINRVFRKLQEHGIQIAWSKMELCKTDLEYLGMRFSNDQISPSPTILNKLFDLVSVDCSKISNWRTVQGLLNQYHRFGPRFQWLVQQFRTATETKRRKILQQLSMWRVSRGNCSKAWSLYTDWCSTGQGYTLFNDRQRPVCWNSKANTIPQSRYSSALGEISAAVWALQDTMMFWRGVPIQLCTDSKDFIFMWNNISKVTDIRILRRLDLLLETPNLTLKFTPGAFNKFADFLVENQQAKKFVPSVQGGHKIFLMIFGEMHIAAISGLIKHGGI